MKQAQSSQRDASPRQGDDTDEDGDKDAEMIAEAKLLRQHKGRLEARMQILEDHNRQLEAQLQRLRQLLEQVLTIFTLIHLYVLTSLGLLFVRFTASPLYHYPHILCISE